MTTNNSWNWKAVPHSVRLLIERKINEWVNYRNSLLAETEDADFIENVHPSFPTHTMLRKQISRNHCSFLQWFTSFVCNSLTGSIFKGTSQRHIHGKHTSQDFAIIHLSAVFRQSVIHRTFQSSSCPFYLFILSWRRYFSQGIHRHSDKLSMSKMRMLSTALSSNRFGGNVGFDGYCRPCNPQMRLWRGTEVFLIQLLHDTLEVRIKWMHDFLCEGNRYEIISINCLVKKRE